MNKVLGIILLGILWGNVIICQENDTDSKLVEQLANPVAKIREQAINMVGEMMHEKPFLVRYLVKALSDQNLGVREAAEDQFLHFQDGDASISYEKSQVTQYLIDAMLTESSIGKYHAINAFAKTGIKNEVVVPVLITFLSNSDQPIKISAIAALGSLEGNAATAVLEISKLLVDPYWAVRSESAWAIGNIGEPASLALPLLITAFDDENKEVVMNAIWACGRVAPKSRVTMPALIKALTNPDRDIRKIAIETLGVIGSTATSAATDIAQILLTIAMNSSEDVWCRQRAIYNLGGLGKQVMFVLPYLHKMAVDPDDRIRKAVQWSLEQLNENEK